MRRPIWACLSLVGVMAAYGCWAEEGDTVQRPPTTASANGASANTTVASKRVAAITRAPTSSAAPAQANGVTPPAILIPEPAWSPRPPRPRAVAEVQPQANAPQGADAAAQFTSEGNWDTAGYNNDEIIYTIFITNKDSRILRCSTELKGFYYENGEKHTVADRQSTTVFPQQRTQAGNWQGMDKSSGATYSVKCHPV